MRNFIASMAVLLQAVAPSCMGQGSIFFNNRSIGNVVAPIYGPKTNAPFTRLSGNAVTNGGSTDYTGYPLLFGTGYTAELWAETSAGNDIFAPLAGVAAKVQFRTAATLGGFLQNSGASILVPFVPGPANSSWRFQVRAWDNGGSLSSSFDDAFFAGRAAGISDIFTSPVIAGPSTPGQIVGFTSFNLVLQLPRFTVSGSAVGDGTVTLSPLKLTYATGEVVQVTATPGRWQAFTHWNDGATDNPRSVIAESNMTLTAYFSPTSVVVSASSVGNGAVALAPFRILYSTGEVVQATATAARWHAFTQWNDGAITNPRFIIAASNAVFTAYFAPTQALETLTYGNVSRLAPVGMPAVFVDGTFIVESNASARGSAAVSLATTFGNGTLLFTLDGSTPGFSSRYFDGPFEVKGSATLRAVAYNSDFTKSQQSDPVEIIILPTLTAHAAGGGSVTVDPPAGAYFADRTATVTATPAPGWTFLKWLGDASGTNLTTSVSVSRNRCVQAIFGTAFGVTTVGSGSVATSPVMDLYPYGSSIRLTAVPQVGNYFVFWGNAATGTNNPLTFTITTPNSTASAVFTALSGNNCSLTVIADGLGRVTASPRANRYTIGTSVTLTALPDAGQDFLGWSGDATSTDNPLTMTMSASRVITAQFTQRPRLSLTPCLDGFNDAGFRFTLQGEVGAVYRIDSGTVLPNWTRHWMFTNALGTDQITDPFATNDLRRFYRVERLSLME